MSEHYERYQTGASSMFESVQPDAISDLSEDDEVSAGQSRRLMYAVVVTAQAQGSRLDAFLGSSSAFLSRSAAAHAIGEDRVLINGHLVTSKSAVVSQGDRVEVLEGDAEPPDSHGVVGEPIPLDIRYEDEYLIVLSKQRGLVSHPAPGHPSHTLANALVYHCGAGNLGTVQGEDRPGIVHRLDMDTTGLMLAAKSDESQRALQDMIRLRTVDRRYLSLVQGDIGPDSGMIDAPIARSPKDRLRMAVVETPGARQAITTFKVLERFEPARGDEGYTLVECHLYTGRTHQIRVHMAYINHPVVGDPLYGRGNEARNLGLARQFLHSWSLAFTHPFTGEDLRFFDSPPYDLTEALESLGARGSRRTEDGEEVAARLERVELLKEHAEWADWL